MTSGPRRFRSGYRNPATNEWVLGASDAPDAIVGYYDPDADQWAEGVADIDSGAWIPVDAVRPSEGRDCPPGFPVKGNLPSRVFHSPGQANYDRTTPEVCFASEAAARDAGFRHARAGAAAPAAAAAAAPAAPAAAPVAAAAAAPVVAATAPRPDAGTPTPPPPPRPTAPPPPREPERNWLWWILGALAIAALLWWFFFRPQQQPAVEPTPAATVAAPAATEEEDEQPLAIVATPAKASPVSGRATPVRTASPAALRATPISSTADATSKATPGLATAVADAIETAEAELEDATSTAEATETP
jgi:hypothetical protein